MTKAKKRLAEDQVNLSRSTIVFVLVVAIIGGSIFTAYSSSIAAGINDDDLVISFEQPGVQETDFDDVTLTVERFGTAPAGPGLNFQRGTYSPTIGTFTGGLALLAGDEKAGTAYAVDRGDAPTDADPRQRMLVVENDGYAQRVNFQMSSSTSNLKYLGFWWGSGNTGSNQNVIEFYRGGTLVADYDAGDIDDNLDDSGSGLSIDDYMGNPNYCWQGANRPDAVRCRDSGELRPNAVTVGLATWVITQPYVFVNFRLEAGFDEVRFWRGTAGGFELDNMTVAREVPTFDTDEVRAFVTGSDVVTDCSGFSDQNAQYVLRNGSFEDPYFTNAAGTTTESIEQGLVVRGNASWMQLRGATSTLDNRIQFWKTTSSSNLIELQRQLSGQEATAARNGSDYLNYFARPADGIVHAEINADQQADLYQDLVTVPGQKITWSIKHRGRYFGQSATTHNEFSTTANDRDKFEVKIGPSSGTLSAQTPARKQLPNVIWNTGNAEYGNNAFTSFTTSSSGHTAQTIYTRLEEGWVLYTGTYTVPSGQTSTRFAFSSRGSGTVGNLIDDIRFDPIIACPRNVTIQRSNSASFSTSPLESSQIPGYVYPDTTNVTSVSINGGVGTATLDTSSGAINLMSNTVGTYQVLYTITDVNNQTSTSTITVQVEDATSQLPNVLLVDPRDTSVAIPAQTLAGSTNAMLCIRQVGDADGAAWVGSPNIEVNHIQPVSGDANRENFIDVDFDATNDVSRLWGPTAALQAEIPFLILNGTGGSPLAPSGSKFFRMGITAADEFGGSACFAGGETFVVEIRSLELRGSATRRIVFSN